ncbi:Ribosomal large subunit pseudouridine synthase D [Urinicoccus massiliensis]|uniref:Pseudouridine synthase n=1 Tax=Urinicoccus massiliensis TaxID=1723382 RepID=A0A8H2M549_9FIRM|nr:RluA family pseudouridine synthase [Urinicoccus massiliensis]VFB16306.1 Ribosomal large subunit pseudouridine synthase D [Urinicoccus massiliensis]
MEKIIQGREGLRLDVYLSEKLGVTRSQIKKMNKEKRILVNHQEVKAGFLLSATDEIHVFLKESYQILPVNKQVDIYYEDEDLLVVNKPKNLVVHPGAGEEEDSLVHRLLYKYPDLPGLDDSLRPGIVHRLDKDTEGLLLVAKNEFAMTALMKDFKSRRVKKIYQCIVHGLIKEPLTIDNPIARSKIDRKKMTTDPRGKKAISHIRPLGWGKNKSLLEVSIVTGRTHQIRVHLKSIGHSIIGDQTYSHPPFYGLDSQALAATQMSFIHPRSHHLIMVQRPRPEYFDKIMEK